MIFGPVPVAQAAGAILAHSLAVGDLRLKKGVRLGAADLAALAGAGVTEITVARLEPGDLDEDAAAARIADALATESAHLTPPVTGRVNLVADVAGLVRVDGARINDANRVDPAITLATLPDFAAVAPDQLLATLKIIPYGVRGRRVSAAVTALGSGAIEVLPFRGGQARLVLTRTPGFKDSLIDKGRQAVAARVEALGYDLSGVEVVDHTVRALAEALTGPADLTLILAASATSDPGDVTPAAIEAAGGHVLRVGMPVDPGNLLVLGEIGGAPVVGLPGCARSPALNGADWVLERIAAGLTVTSADIAAMGVGGLLKEMPDRPTPRRRRAPPDP